MQLHKPEQPSITDLPLALSFSMRLKSIFNITPVTAKSGICTCVAFVFKGFPFVLHLFRKGFSEVADWLQFRSRGSGRWLVLQSLGLVSAGKRNLAHELTERK